MALMRAPGPTATRPRRSPAARRAGYLVGALVNAALLYLVNVRPGWEALPFLTDDAAEVVPWVNLSIVVGMVANLASLLRDQPWVRSLGDLATSVVSCVVLLQLLRVFPFDFSGDDEWRGTAVRMVLWLLVAGTAIGAVVSLVALARRTTGASGTAGQG